METHVERELRYLVQLPAAGELAAFAFCDILQIYLPPEAGQDSRRIRKTVRDGTATYSLTVKTRLDRTSCTEGIAPLSAAQFEALAAERVGEPLVKRRYLIPYDGLTFELDLYAGVKGCAMLEVETQRPESAVTLPPFLRLIRAVTGEKRLSNAALALEGFPPPFEPE